MFWLEFPTHTPKRWHGPDLTAVLYSMRCGRALVLRPQGTVCDRPPGVLQPVRSRCRQFIPGSNKPLISHKQCNPGLIIVN